MSIRVEATQLGFYRNRRWRPGDVFTLDDEKQFSKVWMKKLEAAPVRPANPTVNRGRSAAAKPSPVSNQKPTEPEATTGDQQVL